jgi:hypothetical protein
MFLTHLPLPLDGNEKKGRGSREREHYIYVSWDAMDSASTEGKKEEGVNDRKMEFSRETLAASLLDPYPSLLFGKRYLTGRKAGRQASRQAGKQAGSQAGAEANVSSLV